MNKKSVAATALLGGLVIFGIKLYAWSISGSVAILSDALESIVNILASAMMMFSVWVGERPPDLDHKYGHQKIENISCLIEGLLVLLAGVLITGTALTRIFTPISLKSINFAVLISLGATSLNGLISRLLMRTATDTNSLALEGDAKHLLSDVITSVGVAVGLFVGQSFNMPILDPLLAILVSFFVVKMGLGLVRKSSSDLMDESCSEIEREIRRIVDMHKTEFVNYHNLKTRKSGNLIFSELHLSLNGSISVQEAHDFTDHLEEDIREELPQVSMIIHVEPENLIK